LVPDPEYFALVGESVAACHALSFVVLLSLALRAVEVFCTAMETAINGYASISFVGLLFYPFSALEKSQLIYSYQILVQVLFPRRSFWELSVEKQSLPFCVTECNCEFNK